MTLVAVVMNSVNGAWADTKSLLDYGFDNFECKNENQQESCPEEKSSK